MCIAWFATLDIPDESEKIWSQDFESQWAISPPKTNSYLSKLVTWILKLRDIFAKTLAWFVSPWKSVRPIPVLRWGWWGVFQHGRLSWAPPSWILNSPPDWLKITWRPSWIWKTIESIVLETIAYCLSRLLIGYASFKPRILLSWRIGWKPKAYTSFVLYLKLFKTESYLSLNM